MKPAEIEAARLVFIAMLKAISEHSTMLTGEFKMKLKHDFQNLIKHSDDLIASLEGKLNPDQVEFIQDLTDVYHNLNLEIRNKAVEKYEGAKG